jgi:hypothetical protein
MTFKCSPLTSRDFLDVIDYRGHLNEHICKVSELRELSNLTGLHLPNKNLYYETRGVFASFLKRNTGFSGENAEVTVPERPDMPFGPIEFPFRARS